MSAAPAYSTCADALLATEPLSQTVLEFESAVTTTWYADCV